MPDLFKDILPDLNFRKEHLIRDGSMDERDYIKSQFIVNKAFSMMPDTILYANDMNMHYDLDPMLQYDYFINSLRIKKRYSKWAKSTTDTNLEFIKQVYQYSDQKAKEVLSILSDAQIESLKLKMDKGGKDNEFSKKRGANT